MKKICRAIRKEKNGQDKRKRERQRNINTEININLEENSEEWGKIFEASKAEEVPVIKINKQLLVPNVSFKTIDEAAQITKKFLA